jgi:regulator of protease activity HflC (stomatin/prohibitin superfamily)
MPAATIAILVIAVLAIVLMIIFISRSIWLVPPSRARNVERLGQFHKTMEPGLNMVLPMIDKVKDLIDLREQVVSFTGQRVITEDNVGVSIDTVLFFQVTDPRAADYEIVDYIGAIEQLAATMLRSVIGSMDLEQTLTSRDKINTALRGVLDDASGKWGIRVTRVEIRSIDPPQTIKDAMEKQLKAEREKRAAILHAEGLQQSQILTAQGDKQGAVLRAEGEKQAAILRAEGQAQAIKTVFQSIHDGDPDPKLLAYQYLQTLPQLAAGEGNTVWMIPSELTGALRMLTSAFGGTADAEATGSVGSASLGPVGVPIPAPRPSQPTRTAEVASPPVAQAAWGQPAAAAHPALPGQPPALHQPPAPGQRQVPGQRPTYVPEAPPTAPMPEYGQRSDADGQAGR